MDEVIWAVTVITMLLYLLIILDSSGKMYHELFKYAFNAIGIIAINAFLLITFFFQVCHSCGGGYSWLTAFELLQKKEAHHPRLPCTGHGQVVGYFFVVPKAHHVAALNRCHRDVGHQGGNCTLSLLGEHFWWPGMANHMQQSIKSCVHCLQHRAICPKCLYTQLWPLLRWTSCM